MSQVPWIIHCPPGVDPTRLTERQRIAFDLLGAEGGAGVLLIPHDTPVTLEGSRTLVADLVKREGQA